MKERRLLTFLFLLFFSLLFRIYQLGETTLYPDEISWMVRGKEAVYALKQLNLEFFQYVWWNSNTENESIGLPVSLLSGLSLILFGQGQSGFSLNLLPDYVAGRLPIAIISALFIPIFYFLSTYFFSKKVSLLAAVLLALDSTHIGISRWILHDAFLTTCTFIAIISFAIAVKKENKYWLIFSGLFLSLGFLTKPNGLLPFFSWLVFALALPGFKQRIEYLAWGVLSFLFFTLALWPSSWTSPIYSIYEYLIRQTQLSQVGINYYFMGVASKSPPDWFYLFQISAKLPGLVLFCLILALVVFARNFKRKLLKFKKNLFFWGIIVFCLSFFLSISLPDIKLGARYALSLWPWIYLAVAHVAITLFTKKVRTALVVTLILLSFSSAVKYFPENYLFYNVLVGETKGAQELDSVGLCYGSRQALEYVKKCKPKVESVAILGCSNVTAPYYFQGKISTDWQSEKFVIIEDSYRKLLPDAAPVEFFKSKNPEKIIELKGAEVARVYKNEQSVNCHD